jgi:N-glycosylase/DNA lyase
VLRRLPYKEAKKVLMSFDHGIGNKVADCVLLFSLDKLEAFPVDIWIARAMTQLYKKHFRSDLIRRIRRDRRVSPKDYEVLSDFGHQYFGQYAGYAQEYLYYWVRQRQGVCDLD